MFGIELCARLKRLVYNVSPCSHDAGVSSQSSQVRALYWLKQI